MFDKQMTTLAELNSRATKAIADYYNNVNAEYKIKLDLLELALAQIDIMLMYIIQVRYDIRNELTTIPTNKKSVAFGLLDELLHIQDTAKTVSFNLTAVVHTIRDFIKTEIEPAAKYDI